MRDIIVKHRPDLSSSERADLRADADVTHLRNLVLRDAELVRAPSGRLVEAVRELSGDPDVVYAEPNQPVQAATADPYCIAPTAKVMALRVLGADGQGTAAAVASAFEYSGEQGVAVVNASLGSSGPSQAEEDAISSHPNTLYVVSAGNGGSDGVGDDNDQIGFWPCVLAEPNVVCVGATDAND